MTQYKCRVSNEKGQISFVFKSALSEQALIKEISDERLYLISYKEVKNSSKKRFNKREVLDFTETMAIMLESGLSIRDALKVSEGDLVKTLSDSLTKGISFPEAVNELGADFPPIYRGLVKIGDQTGSMTDIFQKLANYLSEEKKMREKIQGALMYPMVILGFLATGILALILFIFPLLKSEFDSSLMDDIINRFQTITIISMIPVTLTIFFIIFLAIASKSKGKAKTLADKIILVVPIFGKIIQLKAFLNIMFSLEVLTQSGFPLEIALKESSTVLSNSILIQAIERIRRAIIGGDKMSFSFQRETVFPERISSWMNIGEASGSVGRVFTQLKNYYQAELDKLTTRIMMLIEPLITLLIGVIMIVSVITFIIPILGMTGGVL